MAAALRRFLILLSCWAVSGGAVSQPDDGAVEAERVDGKRAVVVQADNGILICTADYARSALNLLNSTKDAIKARALIQPCAEAGHDISQYVLSSVYHQYREQNPLFDEDESLKWSERAALQGHPDAQTFHAIALSQYDTETSEDYHNYRQLSMAWYEKAAQQGHPLAQYSLGKYYKQSTMDWTSAYMWLYLSLERFAQDSMWREFAVSQWRDLDSKIPPDELEAAKRRIEQWNAAHPALNKIWPSDSTITNMDNPNLRAEQ